MGPPPPFAVEQWMDAHETTAKYQLAETCCASLSIDELIALSEKKDVSSTDVLHTATAQGYGEIRGSSELRQNLSRLYSSRAGSPLLQDNILITPGAIAANYLALYALIGPGDRVICHYPTYAQLYTVPETLGADVDLWESRPEDKWLPKIEELESLIKPNTKLIILNNPQNPTGAVLPKSLLEKITELARKHSITIFSDEVYRPLFHGITPADANFPPSILSLGYENTIATGSLSKAYALAGIRVGWIASRSKDIVEKIALARDYTTISVSQLDQAVAAFALSPDTIHALLGRNIQLAKTNLELLEKWIYKHDEYASFVKPVAGTTAFVKFEIAGKPVDAVAFCEELQKQTGVSILPGDLGFGQQYKGYVRIGYANHTEIIKDGLDAMKQFMKKEYEDLPVAA
ncbi:hypothetical protein AMS68_003250 [Peltaster fructicola]|uniref:Aminotransferase class I/classII large domain-containing protein n=1 Tax=Peltaster fructicola TaxID=286661 RepID=A0A6H0XSN3_9PEZI|nr:hypothetical protein AMS68_003250 [Peltaster fructicola]